MSLISNGFRIPLYLLSVTVSNSAREKILNRPVDIEKREQMNRTMITMIKSQRHNLIRHHEMFTTVTFTSSPSLERGIQLYNQTGRIQLTTDMDGTDRSRVILDVIKRIKSLKELPDIELMKSRKAIGGCVGALGACSHRRSNRIGLWTSGNCSWHSSWSLYGRIFGEYCCPNLRSVHENTYRKSG